MPEQHIINSDTLTQFTLIRRHFEGARKYITHKNTLRLGNC